MHLPGMLCSCSAEASRIAFRLPPNARSRSLAVLDPMFGIPRPLISAPSERDAAAEDMPAIAVAARFGPNLGRDCRSTCRDAKTDGIKKERHWVGRD